MKKNLNKLLLLIAILPLAAACSNNIKSKLGVHARMPDEFKVISNPPLSVPPEFSLRPPVEDFEKTNSANANGATIVFEKASADIVVPEYNRTATQSENAFLNRVGESNPDIRHILSKEEEAAMAEENKSLLDKLPGFGKDEKAAEPVVDASKERERIAKNKQEGVAVTEGETPTTTGGKKGIFNKIFGL